MSRLLSLLEEKVLICTFMHSISTYQRLFWSYYFMKSLSDSVITSHAPRIIIYLLILFIHDTKGQTQHALLLGYGWIWSPSPNRSSRDSNPGPLPWRKQACYHWANRSALLAISCHSPDSPFITGAMLQTDMGPSWLYWPRAVSIRYMGLPTNTRIMMYGNKKAPGDNHKDGMRSTFEGVCGAGARHA